MSKVSVYECENRFQVVSRVQCSDVVWCRVLQVEHQGLTASSGKIAENTDSHRCLMF